MSRGRGFLSTFLGLVVSYCSMPSDPPVAWEARPELPSSGKLVGEFHLLEVGDGAISGTYSVNETMVTFVVRNGASNVSAIAEFRFP